MNIISGGPQRLAKSDTTYQIVNYQLLPQTHRPQALDRFHSYLDNPFHFSALFVETLARTNFRALRLRGNGKFLRGFIFAYLEI